MKKINRFFEDNKYALLVLFIISLITFGYLGTNAVVNIDGIQELVLNKADFHYCDFIGYLYSGRWGWGIISYIFGYYPAPVFLLVFNSALFSISAIILSKIFNIKKNFNKILIGLVLIAFPYGINMYAYLGHQYIMGIAYFSCIYGIYKLINVNKWYDYVISILFLTFGISIYQTYIPFIAVLMVFISIMRLNKKDNIKLIIKDIFKYLLVMIISCVLYAVILKILLALTNSELTSYQGINTMFEFEFKDVINNFGKTFAKIFQFDTSSNFFPKILQFILCILILAAVSLNLKNVKIKYYPLYILLVIVLFMSPRLLQYFKPYSSYHVLTKISFSVYYAGFIGLLLYNIENFKKSFYVSYAYKVITVLVVFVGLAFLVKDNQASYMVHQVSNFSFSIINRLQMKIEKLNGYDKTKRQKILFLGYSPYWLTGNTDVYYHLETGITLSFVVTDVKFVDALNVLGGNYEIFQLKDNNQLYFEAKEYAENHKNYPADGSVFMYKDLIVVKFN